MGTKKRWLRFKLLELVGLPIVSVVSRLLAGTLRVTWRDRQFLQPLLEGDTPVIYAFWHHDLIAATRLGLAVRLYRNIAIMTSLSRDGELYTKALRSLGYAVVRGSSSRDAVRGIVRLKRAIESGCSVAVAVDGPRGPRHVVKPGVVLLAKITGAPILRFNILLARKKTLHSWDRCEVPLPFTKCEVVLHAPLYVSSEADHTEIEAIRQQLERTLLLHCR